MVFLEGKNFKNINQDLKTLRRSKRGPIVVGCILVPTNRRIDRR